MTKRIATTLLLASTLAFPAFGAAQQGAAGALTYELARTAIDAAEAEARRNGWNVTIVVADAEGMPVYVRRLDGASPRTHDVAMRKAATVAATGLTTAVYGQRLEAGSVPEVPDGTPFAGGVPILRGGQLIGAIGTSGVAAVDDERVSQAGADAIAN